MSSEAVGGVAFLGLLVLILLRVPVGLSMLLAGMGGYVALSGWTPLLAFVKSSTWYTFSTYSLSVIPLFVLMGNFALEAGVSRALFAAGNAAFGRMRGGLAMATVGACAGFGAICGSSVATTAAMGQIALGEMRRYGYSGGLSTGTIAVGGTLGILIPPSVILALYGLVTEQNIAKLFMAALIPGLLAAASYIVAIAIYVRLVPGQAPDVTPVEERHVVRDQARGIGPVALIFGISVGGIYGGVFTPTEGAGVGATLTFLMAVVQRSLSWGGFARVLASTAETTGLIFLILLGAEIFNAFLALSRLPVGLSGWFAGLDIPAVLVLGLMLLFYIALGCVMDELAMILLTLPIFFPIVMGLDFGMPAEDVAIWFGVLVVVVVGIGLAAPPVGLNVFVINGIARDVPMAETFKGVMPFLIADLLRLALLIAFPPLSLAMVHWLT